MDTQNVLYPYSGILFSIIKECTADISYSMDGPHKHHLSETSQTQKTTYCMIPFI